MASSIGFPSLSTTLPDRENDCATADAYATAFMVMGIEKAQELLKRHPEIMAYFIYAGNDGKNKTWCSESLKGKIVEK